MRNKVILVLNHKAWVTSIEHEVVVIDSFARPPRHQEASEEDKVWVSNHKHREHLVAKV